VKFPVLWIEFLNCTYIGVLEWGGGEAKDKTPFQELELREFMFKVHLGKQETANIFEVCVPNYMFINIFCVKYPSILNHGAEVCVFP